MSLFMFIQYKDSHALWQHPSTPNAVFPLEPPIVQRDYHTAYLKISPHPVESFHAENNL